MTLSRARTYLAILVMPAMALALAACGLGDDRTTLERARETGSIRVGFANERPYAYTDTATGRLTGESPEIARVILADMGITDVEGVLTAEFGALIPGLNAGRFDIIAAGMYITPERCEQIEFSNPTYGIGEAFAVLAGNPKELNSFEDIRDHEDATIGIVTGAIQRSYAQAIGIPEDRIVMFSDASGALDGVRTGRVDAYAGTAFTVQEFLELDDSGTLERAEPFTDPVIDGETARGYGAYGFRKGDVDFVAEFNARLADFIGSEEHQALVAEFGFTEAELPGDVTAADLCTP